MVDLGFGDNQADFTAEGLAYAADGTVIKGIAPRNAYVPLTGSGPVELYLEAAANPNVGGDWTFSPTPYGDLATAGSDPPYQLRRLELGLLDRCVWELEQDLFTLVGLVHELSPSRSGSARASQKRSARATGATCRCGRSRGPPDRSIRC